MPYVIQNENGNIIAISETTQNLTSVWMEEDDPIVRQLIDQRSVEDNLKTPLGQSDLDLIRVIEDLTDLLIKKQVFTFTELPLFVQHKLGNRQKLRHDMISLKSLLSDENESGIC